MLTGRHVICDVSCNTVYTKLAWMHGFATEIGVRINLEGALVTEIDGIVEHMGDN
jgi:hypothetical protein